MTKQKESVLTRLPLRFCDSFFFILHKICRDFATKAQVKIKTFEHTRAEKNRGRGGTETLHNRCVIHAYGSQVVLRVIQRGACCIISTCVCVCVCDIAHAPRRIRVPMNLLRRGCVLVVSIIKCRCVFVCRVCARAHISFGSCGNAFINARKKRTIKKKRVCISATRGLNSDNNFRAANPRD